MLLGRGGTQGNRKREDRLITTLPSGQGWMQLTYPSVCATLAHDATVDTVTPVLNMRKAKKPRKGKPVLGLTMTEREVELVDAYRFARGLDSRSKALRELVRFAFGDNTKEYSIIDEMPEGARNTDLVEALRIVRMEVFKIEC